MVLFSQYINFKKKNLALSQVCPNSNVMDFCRFKIKDDYLQVSLLTSFFKVTVES